MARRADIVEPPHFVTAVQKVQGGKERDLSTLEITDLRPFLRNSVAVDIAQTTT